MVKPLLNIWQICMYYMHEQALFVLTCVLTLSAFSVMVLVVKGGSNPPIGKKGVDFKRKASTIHFFLRHF